VAGLLGGEQADWLDGVGGKRYATGPVLMTCSRFVAVADHDSVVKKEVDVIAVNSLAFIADPERSGKQTLNGAL
jgi:hypothetical protein